MSNAQAKGERNYGIELFRIFSMLMIVILHINMNGGLMGCFPNVDAKYTTLWFGETFCFASGSAFTDAAGTFSGGAERRRYHAPLDFSNQPDCDRHSGCHPLFCRA